MAIINIDGFNFYDNLKGEPETFIIKGIELDKELNFIKRNNIKSVSIECSKIKDISFLEEINFIEDVTLNSSFENYLGLYFLFNLKRITINVDDNYPKFDYSKFTYLEYLSIDWYKNFPDLSNNSNLKILTIWKYKPKSKAFEELQLPDNLESLKITESNINDFYGLRISKLKKIEGHYCRNLKSLNGIDKVSQNLEVLILDYCKKLTDYNELKKCLNLKKIILGDCGDIPSLKWLTKLNYVSYFSFWNTKVVDGDLLPCKGIKHVSFKNSRHYNYKVESFKE
jgi:Leucine-rich repeat (LRR) protein